jgi:hypothetical protein
MGLTGWTVDVAAGVDWEGIFLGIVDCCEVDCVAVDGFEGVDVPGEEFVSGRMTWDAPLVVTAFYHRLLLCLQTTSECRDTGYTSLRGIDNSDIMWIRIDDGEYYQ